MTGFTPVPGVLGHDFTVGKNLDLVCPTPQCSTGGFANFFRTVADFGADAETVTQMRPVRRGKAGVGRTSGLNQGGDAEKKTRTVDDVLVYGLSKTGI